MITLPHYLTVSAALFTLGLLGVLTRRNAVNVLMGIELILNSANLNLVASSRYGTGNLQGQLFAVFVIVIAAGLLILLVCPRLSIGRFTFEGLFHRADWAVKAGHVLAPTTREIGQLFMGRFLLPFEASSILLLVALIGAALIVRRRKDA